MLSYDQALKDLADYSKTISDQRATIERLQKERDEWQQKWMAAIHAAQAAGLLSE